ncbi:DUF6635 family protein [Sedimentitalea sp. XS_ASV28]|uniref:DUF6635 family protein n=1 Tax=Sedimentitalea sp. XS_ASV28 TaxID=3241296 RepID=UPI003516B904
MIRRRASAAEAEALGQRIAGALGEYAGARSAVAEMTTTLCVLVICAIAFQTLTPGMISMAPGVADAMARTNAIATFPPGQTLGGVWYGVFDVNASAWLVGTAVAGLVMIGSVFAAFAGAFWIRWRRSSAGAATNPSLRASTSLPTYWIFRALSRVQSASSGTDPKHHTGPVASIRSTVCTIIRINGRTFDKSWIKCTLRLRSSFC